MNEEQEPAALARVGARYLTPQNAVIFIGRLGSIHCVIDDREAYANVYCQLCFPIAAPLRYIAVCHTDDEGKEEQLGVIEELTAFSDETQGIIRRSLRRQYFEQTIARVHSVKWEFGLLVLEVSTEEGRRSFMMRWQHDRAVDFGKNGKVLLDVWDNRYIIPSVEDLPPADRGRLMRFIYW
jgi:hypothetical protein